MKGWEALVIIVGMICLTTIILAQFVKYNNKIIIFIMVYYYVFLRYN